MSSIHTVIVPGVGGSEYEHWQSWLQRQLRSCSRVQQTDWNMPILQEWIAQFVKTVSLHQEPLQIVAHSFGCLTSIAALAEYPELAHRIKNLVLVAPANPERFGEAGFARNSQYNYAEYFQNLKIRVPAQLIISDNDPWFKLEDAQFFANAWNLKPVSLGKVGHINVASGFGPFPEIFDFLIAEKNSLNINITDNTELFFRFAI
ncbi:esterase [Acinetobacter radioresistens]|uniref:RBBP9/YdeN family alpha/beta hydrolase n=1 Tax=Acinetobacter radioresistens TaxID=40216 RepID=UPI000D0B440F|nr:alpha/beta hydrolase [Acinetobacter radioresistens]MCK4088831.1 alpha/beta hydrolase [Acinetobacter radioresistens]MCU4594843.1 alpha/beta hydrolase [Acinetobacter radioresistens]PSD37135.1 esterase [Acinetobacter radioresistens]PSD38967.1 esterase [Acinetobacter radioresistens]